MSLISPPQPATSAPLHLLVRFAAWTFALILGAQGIWLLLAELAQPSIPRLPTDAATAAAAAARRGDAAWAARWGSIRGDLWATSAFTFADLLWREPSGDTNALSSAARAALDRALALAPHRADIWLLMAGLAARYHWPDLDAAEALRMSYYTGLSEPSLMPLRLRVAARLDDIRDDELQRFVRQDVRLLLARQRSSAVDEAYDDASPAGRRLIEAAVGEIDPSRPGLLRARGRRL